MHLNRKAAPVRQGEAVPLIRQPSAWIVTESTFEERFTHPSDLPANLVPVVGAQFTSHDDTITFLNHYSQCFGFSMRVDKVVRAKAQDGQKVGEIRNKTVLCSAAGSAESKGSDNRQRGSTRTERPVYVRFSLDSTTSLWQIIGAQLVHNHLLLPPDMSKNLPRHRDLNHTHLEQIRLLRAEICSDFREIEHGVC